MTQESNNMKGTANWDMMPCSHLKVSISEENVTCIFTVEEQAKQDMVMKQAFRGLHGVNITDDKAS